MSSQAVREGGAMADEERALFLVRVRDSPWKRPAR